MFKDVQIFLWDVEQLKEIQRNPSPRNLLASSAILRRILMDDGVPLIHKVSRELDLKIRFTVFYDAGKNEFDQIIENIPVKRGLKHIYINPDTTISNNAKTKDVDLGEFLAVPMFLAQDKSLTVKEIIRYCANVGGGVHKGVPRDRDNAKIIHETANEVWFNNVPYPIEIMRNIVNICVEAFQPAYDRIKA